LNRIPKPKKGGGVRDISGPNDPDYPFGYGLLSGREPFTGAIKIYK
jgi:hypothetical protein